MNILFLNNIPVPYRMDFFNELGKKVNLTILMEAESVPHLNNDWLKSYNVNNFKYIVLPSIYSGKEVRLNYGITKFLKDKQYDLIIIGGYSSFTQMLAIIYLKMKNIPFILNCDGGLIKNDNYFKRKIKSYFIKSASFYLSTGKNTDEYLIHYGANIERIYKYPFTSITKKDIKRISFLEKEKIRQELSISTEKVIIGVGQFIHRKGFDLLIECFANVTGDVSLYIIGGEITKEYDSIIKKYNIKNIHFIKFKNKLELEKYYKVADIFVLPTREDVWGLVINEAMSKGIPVITTTKCVAGLELIENEINGFLVPVDNPNLLSKYIQLLINDEARCNIIRENNFSKIEQYTIENMVNIYMGILKTIMKIVN